MTKQNISASEDSSVIDIIYKRRAVRTYTAEKVDKETINRLLDAAVHAPTAMHEETWQFVVIQDKNILNEISEGAKKLFAQEDHAEVKGHSFDSFKRPDFNIFYDASTLIVIYGKQPGQFVAADCWLAAENLILSACSLGLGTCVIGFAVNVLNKLEWKKKLGVPLESTAFAPIIVGVQNGITVPTSRKKPDIVCWK